MEEVAEFDFMRKEKKEKSELELNKMKASLKKDDELLMLKSLESEKSLKGSAEAVVADFTEEKRKSFYKVGKAVAKEFKATLATVRMKLSNAKYDLRGVESEYDIRDLQAEVTIAEEDLALSEEAYFECLDKIQLNEGDVIDNLEIKTEELPRLMEFEVLLGNAKTDLRAAMWKVSPTTNPSIVSCPSLRSSLTPFARSLVAA